MLARHSGPAGAEGEVVAKPRPEKKCRKSRAMQPQLPGMPPHPPPGTIRVLPMQLQPGDRLTDSTGEWEVVVRPYYTTAGGKTAHVRLQRVGQSGSVEIRSWGAHERVAVKRAADVEPAGRPNRCPVLRRKT